MLDSEPIPTLPVSRLLLYLCVHGALDGWLRLKWLADIAALLRSMTAEGLARTTKAATQQQALPQLSAAVYLCQDMLGDGSAFPMPAGCLRRKRHKTSARHRGIRQTAADFEPVSSSPMSRYPLRDGF